MIDGPDAHSESGSLHPILLATLHMDETFEGFRRDLLPPYPEPTTSDEHWTLWHEHELRSRQGCEDAIDYWIERRTRPDLNDNVAFYLCRRFDEASHFLQSLFLDDQTTVFSHVGYSLDEFLTWVLVDWWEAHGIREAYFESLSMYEHTHESDEQA